ncbi:NAD(P)-binding domain-containing protein [Actinomadura bangladeshensis]|uniref:NAD-binding protein n=1 Tax=Actinomadura bangladeshensis TaxID=453573 RepID=A0A6L9QUN6_9ACTN|nr:NAD(P)-binding domain-containing protein [Actinomadura bangladeshensis]NEA29215.1 NAD-binding protein [Actinomadura bangladeshensis]
MTRIAFLGLGRMGSPMAGRLLAAGHDVSVWNRTPGRAAPLAGAGAAVHATPAEAVADRDLVITMLTDADAVEDVLFGPLGAAPALEPAAVIADMSTIGPDAVRRVRDRLPAGIGHVDAPVSGSVPQAEAGELVILAGAADADLARCAAAFEALGTVRHVGPPGSGAALKVVVNSVLVGNFAVLGEALAIADRLGVDTGLALDALSRISSQARRLLDDAGPPRFTLALAAKDLALALDGPGRTGVLSAVQSRTESALAAGLAGHDLTALADHTRRSVPMRVTLGNPATVPAPPNPAYSHTAYVTQGPMLYVSGQIALDENGKVDAPGDMTRQSEVVMSLLERILAAHGAGFADVVGIRSFLTDIDLRAEYGAVRARYFTGAPPTSTTVEVPRLFHPDALLEVEIVAAVP